MRNFQKSHRLDKVLYDIRGPVLKEAKRLEEEGFRILKLNIGNPAPFGFNAPDEVLHDIIINLSNAQGYGDSRGLFAARKAVMHDCQTRHIMDVTLDDIFIGNGVSELIQMAMQALLDTGDEVLIPMPDYPLWTAAVTLQSGLAVHYRCDESAGWNPDLDDIRSKITDRTNALVVINPNNPTGAVYSRETLEGLAAIAAEHSLIVFADEIYGRITYEDARFIPFATINPDILTVSFDGLSKAWSAAGFRSGWMTLSGNKRSAADYIEGLDMLANMRLCANMPSQFGIQTALGGYQSVNEFILPGGRLLEQRNAACDAISAIPGLSVVKPQGALYCFPKIDTELFGIKDDEQFVMDLLHEKHILLVQGTGFNWDSPDHFRVVLLPDKETLTTAINRMGEFLATYRQS
jgi:alanine-synthesizing transaminase